MTPDAVPERRATLKERAINRIIQAFVNHTNRSVNVQELQRKYHATDEKLVRMTVSDLADGRGRSWHFRVKDGRLDYVSDPGQERVDGGFETTADALVWLVLGKRKAMDPATGRTFDESYTPADAVLKGGVRVWGKAASNDVLLLARAIYAEVYPKVRDDVSGSMNGVNQ